MPETMSCATCAFSELVGTPDGAGLQCRRYPPSPTYDLAMLAEPDTDDPAVLFDSDEFASLDAERKSLEVNQEAQRWPVARPDEWCGEWYPDESDELDDDQPYAEGEVDAIPHNLIAHPLLIIWPALGRRIHDRTQPTVIEGPWSELARDLLRFVLFVTLVAAVALVAYRVGWRG